MLHGAKKTALCVVDYPYWITAKMAAEISRNNRNCRVYVASVESVLAYGKKNGSIFSGFNVIHFLTPHLYPRCRHLLSDKNAVVTSVHHLEDSRHNETIQESDAIGTLCSQWTSRLIESGVPCEKLFRIGIGVDLNVFSLRDTSKKHDARKKYKIKPDEFVIGFVAKASSDTSDRKGIDVFEKACCLANDRIEKLKVFIVGNGWQKAVKSMRQKGIQVLNVKFLPSEKDLVEYYACLNAYIVPSRIEGGPMPLLESLVSGVPVVSTRVGLAEEVIQCGENGYLVPIDDADAIAQRIEQLSQVASVDADLIRGSVTRLHTWELAQCDASRAYDFAMVSKGLQDRDSLTEIDEKFLAFSRAYDAAMVSRYYLATHNYREGALAALRALSLCAGLRGSWASALQAFSK